MVMVVQEDELFIFGVSIGGDVIMSMGIHQDDLVIGEGRGLTEGCQGIVTAWTEGYLGLVMK